MAYLLDGRSPFHSWTHRGVRSFFLITHLISIFLRLSSPGPCSIIQSSETKMDALYYKKHFLKVGNSDYTHLQSLIFRLDISTFLNYSASDLISLYTPSWLPTWRSLVCQYLISMNITIKYSFPNACLVGQTGISQTWNRQRGQLKESSLKEKIKRHSVFLMKANASFLLTSITNDLFSLAD